jgi:hypothetical protein
MTAGNLNRIDAIVRKLQQIRRENRDAQTVSLLVVEASRELANVLTDLILRPEANDGARHAE